MALDTHHGTPAAALAGVTWRKSKRSGCLGNCIEVATLYGREVAM
jgi:hypothetical protein